MASAIPPFALRSDSWGRLVLIDANQVEHVDVVPVRLFPISDPEHFVALQDAKNCELFLIEDLQALPEELQSALRESLALREFLPVIHRINHISSHLEPCEFDVETDRGPVQFVLKADDDVHRLGPHRALIIDAQGVRYLINDTRALDPVSRRFVERYV